MVGNPGQNYSFPLIAKNFGFLRISLISLWVTFSMNKNSRLKMKDDLDKVEPRLHSESPILFENQRLPTIQTYAVDNTPRVSQRLMPIKWIIGHSVAVSLLSHGGHATRSCAR